MGAFDLVSRLITLRGLHAVAKPSHIDLGDRCSLAGVDVFRRQDHIEPTVEIDDISLAERTGDDFHGRNPSIGDEPGDQAGDRSGAFGRNRGPHHTDLVPRRQHFQRVVPSWPAQVLPLTIGAPCRNPRHGGCPTFMPTGSRFCGRDGAYWRRSATIWRRAILPRSRLRFYRSRLATK